MPADNTPNNPQQTLPAGKPATGTLVIRVFASDKRKNTMSCAGCG